VRIQLSINKQLFPGGSPDGISKTMDDSGAVDVHDTQLTDANWRAECINAKDGGCRYRKYRILIIGALCSPSGNADANAIFLSYNHKRSE
jgi:hypothetical protein